jgi:hypothetical protein
MRELNSLHNKVTLRRDGQRRSRTRVASTLQRYRSSLPGSISVNRLERLQQWKIDSKKGEVPDAHGRA